MRFYQPIFIFRLCYRIVHCSYWYLPLCKETHRKMFPGRNNHPVPVVVIIVIIIIVIIECLGASHRWFWMDTSSRHGPLFRGPSHAKQLQWGLISSCPRFECSGGRSSIGQFWYFDFESAPMSDGWTAQPPFDQSLRQPSPSLLYKASWVASE